MRFFLLVVILLTSSCKSGSNSPAEESSLRHRIDINCEQPYQYQEPENIQDGLSVATIYDKDVDVDKLIDMAEKMHCGDFEHQINSVLISLQGELIHEEYFTGFRSASNRTIVDYDKYSLHAIASSTKSITSTLIGLSIDQGYINIDEAKLHDFYTEYADVDWYNTYLVDSGTAMKADISLQDVLTMSAGFKWDEATYSYLDERNDAYKLRNSDDWYRFVLELPLVAVSGEQHVYSSGLSVLLGGIVNKATGFPANEFAEQHLFSPLGIEEYWWSTGPKGEVQTGGGLSLTPRSMQKIGQLFLDGGIWQGQQVISSTWVEEATAHHVDFIQGNIVGYGYQWWMYEFNVNGQAINGYASLGFGGQQIFVFQELDLVVTFTGSEFPKEHGNKRTRELWLQDYILPAIINRSSIVK